ncbi:hypothetical protein [Ichthyobacterium seriolicida]|uniref:Lipoprotein n=1 Tax=Ichthyobacterium seriolicida TaxID=242600 RepID=A0A1J1EB42_9FLAO|nr:hypothetical protein [Ichthyobacterium seriolicida]BAV94736.1 hypothetical protein JBKA6_0723 [Ichthyobacterium seriolicida]
MKTNKIFKNLLSLLTLGLVVFSCNKPSEDPKADQNSKALDLVVTSVKFEKAKNLKENNVSEFYEKLFITKTPARNKLASVDSTATTNGYPTEFTTVPADIVGDSIINIKLPYNSQFIDLTDKATATATITFKSAVEGIKLGETLLSGTTTDITFEIPTTELTKAKLTDAPFKKEMIFSKAGTNATDTPKVKKYTIVVKFSDNKSRESALTVANNKVTALGFTRTTTSGQPNEKIKNDSTNNPMNPKKESAGNGSKASPIELTMTKNVELVDESSISSWKFKADVLTLPNGAFIDATDADFTNVTNHPATDPTAEFTITTASHGIQFRVVAQDGKTTTYYKMTFKTS